MEFSKWNRQGFKGVDVSLELSLLEYGLIWKEFKYNLKDRDVKKGEILAYHYRDYGLNETINSKRLGYGYFQKSDLLDCDWVEWIALADCNGMTVDELRGLNAGNLLFTISNYYGFGNFF